MSGGMKITDRKFFAGSGSPSFPKGVHTKTYSSAEGAGAENDYEDTTEKVKAQQIMGAGKIKSHPMKPLHRN